jgi:exosortase/archaeosortase family protein
MQKERKGILEFLKSKRYLSAIIGILMIFAGIDLMVVGQKEVWPVYIGILILVLGIGFLLFVFLPYLKDEYRERKETLASRFLRLITLRGRLQPFFPVFGIILIIVDIAYNLFISSTPGLLTFDTIFLLFGGWMVVHNFVPKKFERERDFVFMFLFLLVIILVIPLLLMRVLVGNYNDSVDFYSATLLVPPLSGILRIFGVPIYAVDNSCLPEPGGQPICITMGLGSGDIATIGITTECSGIISFAIFASAFLAFVLIEFSRISKRVVALLVLGIFTAYLANLLRMTVIMLVGYHYDSGNLQNMLFAHANVGWIIFLLWISLFWLLMYKFLMKEKPIPVSKKEITKKKGTLCAVCGEMMKVDMPGRRCQCGKFYHQECIESLDKCPNCGRPFGPDERISAKDESLTEPDTDKTE